MLFGLLSRLFEARPCSVADLEAFVCQTFPVPLNCWAVDAVRRHVGVGRQAGSGGSSSRRTVGTGSTMVKEKSAVNTQKVQNILKEVLNHRPDTLVLNYALAILEFIATDILKLTGRYVKNMRHNVITFQDLKVSLTADSVLMDLFFRDGDETLDSSSSPHFLVSGPQIEGQQKWLQTHKHVDVSSTYEQVVKDLIYDETQYLRDLNMLILVFRNAFKQLNENYVSNKAAAGSNINAAYDNFLTNLYENEGVRQETEKNIVDMDRIFSNAVDVRDFTSKFLALLEDTVEMSRDNTQPSVGTCFSEMAQNVQAGFELAVKYVLPKLLMLPIFHCSKYFEYITRLNSLTKSKDDSIDLLDAESLLVMLRKRIELHSADLVRRNISGQFQLRFVPCGQNQLAMVKMVELMKQLDGFDTKMAGKNASEFILEGALGKYHMLQPKLGNTLLGATDTLRTKVSRTTERYAFLFDTMIVLCKPLSAAQLKKAKEIASIAVSTDLKNAFEIRPRSGHAISQAFGPVLLFTKTPEEKQTWMASLIMLQTRSMLERMLDASLAEEENRIPLLLPSVEQYRFAEKDSEDNIIFEDYVSSSGLPIVRGATLPKLIERLTPNQ